MNLVVYKIEEDKEILLLEYEKALYELQSDTLPKGFWTVEEWNNLVNEANMLRSKIKFLKKSLSEDTL